MGYGLEGAVPDLYTDNVMEDIFKPAFQKGDYDRGIRDSYSAFADAIGKEYGVQLNKSEKVTIPNKNNNNNRANSRSGGGIIGVILVLVVLDTILNRGRITREILNLIIWSSFWNNRGGRGGRGGGGFGGFGGGSQIFE